MKARLDPDGERRGDQDQKRSAQSDSEPVHDRAEVAPDPANGALGAIRGALPADRDGHSHQAAGSHEDPKGGSLNGHRATGVCRCRPLLGRQKTPCALALLVELVGGARFAAVVTAPPEDDADEYGERHQVDELDEPMAGVCDDEHQPWASSWACVPRTVCQDCQVIRRITRVIASPMSGSAMSSPSATTAALATTARLT